MNRRIKLGNNLPVIIVVSEHSEYAFNIMGLCKIVSFMSSTKCYTKNYISHSKSVVSKEECAILLVELIISKLVPIINILSTHKHMMALVFLYCLI